VVGKYRQPAAQAHSSVLTKDEVAGLLAQMAQMEGVTALLARLLYGTEMRLAGRHAVTGERRGF
jgi:hypothetical protein